MLRVTYTIWASNVVSVCSIQSRSRLVNVERLIVEVHTYGPFRISGSLEVSGGTETVASIFVPSEEACEAAKADVMVGAVVDRDDVLCWVFKVEEPEEEKVEELWLEDKLTVVVEAGGTFWRPGVIATGQNDQTCLP